MKRLAEIPRQLRRTRSRTTALKSLGVTDEEVESGITSPYFVPVKEERLDDVPVKQELLEENNVHLSPLQHIKVEYEDIKVKQELDLNLNMSPPRPVKTEDTSNESIVHTPQKKTKASKPSTPRTPRTIRKAPAKWEQMYHLIHEFRKQNIADVDTMGCATSAEKSLGGRLFRYQILTSLQLSSQTKDPVTWEAIQNLQNHPFGLSPESVLKMSDEELNSLISKVGYLKKTARILVDDYEGDIPSELEGLLALPGIGPKMAYLTLQEAWGKNMGIGVDTHVHRISNRLGWVKTADKTPEHTRVELEDWLPKDKWGHVNMLLVGFGQTLCKPIGPMYSSANDRCHECPISHLCPKIGAKASPKKKTKKVVD